MIPAPQSEGLLLTLTVNTLGGRVRPVAYGFMGRYFLRRWQIWNGDGGLPHMGVLWCWCQLPPGGAGLYDVSGLNEEKPLHPRTRWPPCGG